MLCIAVQHVRDVSPDHQTIHPWVMTHVGIPVIGLEGHDTHRHLGMPCPSGVCFFCTCGATVLHCILYMQATQHCACHSTLRIVQDSASPHSPCLGEYPPIQMASISSWVMTHVMASPCWTSPPHVTPPYHMWYYFSYCAWILQYL